MRILYLSQYYPPEVGATQTRAYEMTRYLASRGHTVTVITEVPNHPSGIIPPSYKGELSERTVEEGVDVLRLWVWTSSEKNFKTRLRFYLSYMGMAALAGTLLRGRYDVVYATSPPLFVGAAGLIVSAVRRRPFILEVRDLWPESAVALGELGNWRAIRAAELLERLIYRLARRVVAVTQGIADALVERGVPAGKVALIPNGANTEQFTFDAAGRDMVRSQLGLSDKFVVLYAGVHGLAQGLETALRAADLLRGDDNIEFLFIGEGPRKTQLLRLKGELGLDNVRFLPEVPSSRMPSYLSAADCALVPLRDQPVFRGALPSKMFEAWACSRPIVLSVAGEAERVLAEPAGGVAARPESAEALAAAICHLKDNPLDAAAMGERGRAHVEQHYSRRVQAQQLEELLVSAL